MNKPAVKRTVIHLFFAAFFNIISALVAQISICRLFVLDMIQNWWERPLAYII